MSFLLSIILKQYYASKKAKNAWLSFDCLHRPELVQISVKFLFAPQKQSFSLPRTMLKNPLETLFTTFFIRLLMTKDFILKLFVNKKLSEQREKVFMDKSNNRFSSEAQSATLWK